MGLFGLLFIWILINSVNNNKSILKNKKGTVGKVTRISTSSASKSTKRIYFVYYVDGQKQKGSDAYYDGIPKRIRLSKPQIGQYYVVEYDSTHHENHRIVIDRQPLNPRAEINFTNTIEGCVKKQGNLGDYQDLYIDYRSQGSFYSFRTRLHKDSLNLYESEKCDSKKAISIEVSRRYPYFNNLYFKSRDRQYKGAYSTEGKWN